MARSPAPTSTSSIARKGFHRRSSGDRRSSASRACASSWSISRRRKAAAMAAALRTAGRRDDHAAAPPVQPQRPVPGRPAPAHVLPADPETRNAPAGAAQGRDERRDQHLSRHRHGAASCGISRRWIVAAPASSARRSPIEAYLRVFDEERRARPVRSLRVVITAPPSTAWPPASRNGDLSCGAPRPSRGDRAASRRATTIVASSSGRRDGQRGPAVRTRAKIATGRAHRVRMTSPAIA